MSAVSGTSTFFKPLDLSKLFNREIGLLSQDDCCKEITDYRDSIPSGFNVLRGIPFLFGMREEGRNNILLIKNNPVVFRPSEPIEDVKFIVFAHSACMKKSIPGSDGIISPMMGNPRLGEVVSLYELEYEDGTSFRTEIKRRFSINEFCTAWGEGAFEAVHFRLPQAIMTNTEELSRGGTPGIAWGVSQTRVAAVNTSDGYALWLYAMENPFPGKKVAAMSFLPADGTVLISGITLCGLDINPLRWESRKKAVIKLPHGENISGHVDYGKIEIDLGQIISIVPMPDYDNESWDTGYNNKQPACRGNSAIIEYTAHPSAFIRLGGNEGKWIPVSLLKEEAADANGFSLSRIPEAEKRVTLKVTDRRSGRAVPVKIHVHGASGEYLPPVNRHRIPNRFWFEDYSTDFVHGSHLCTYIDGEAEYKLPLGNIYVEVSKGFEVKPVRKKFRITGDTHEIIVELEHVLPWREKGWVTADTHVHFLSPHTALLEGEAEGVNVVNLLASQWGELFTNIGDFDGKTCLGSRESGGDGEYLVRVGTENRQNILGHISLLGYDGRMILPLASGGPDESAMGDPVEETLCGWAKRCREQNGVVILPHFPRPRGEGSAAIVSGLVDGVEMTSWCNLYTGINPYSLSDWYRYLNCGYHVPIVGGTDKMAADTAVGTLRTYAKIKDKPFSYENWKEAIRTGCTFATCGPLIEFTVEGKEMGARIEIPDFGGMLQAEWKVASVTAPVTKIELVVNGETLEVYGVNPQKGEYSGKCSLKVAQNSWIALRVRGCQPGKEEIITAHSSAVMVVKPGEGCFNAPDAYTILEQIEGAVAYMETIAPRAEEKAFKKLIMTLTSAHRALHNRMHQNGLYHNHNILNDHHT
jgi:hypothetical protein